MSQTLTYVMGADRRVHVKDIQDFKIDFSDDNHNWVQARQFERGMRQVFVNIVNEDGTPFDLTGCNVWFEGLLPKTADGDFRVIDTDGYVPLDPSAGKFRFDMPGHAFTVSGSYRQAFFRIVKNGNSVTTLEFDLDVLADKVIDGLVPRTYLSPLEDILAQAETNLQQDKANLQKIVDDFKTQAQAAWNELNQLGTSTKDNLNDALTRLQNLETQIKGDNLFTQSQADMFKQAIQELCNNWIDEVKNARGGYGTLAEKEIAQDNNINTAQKTADQAVNQNVTQDAQIQINKDDIANIRENLPSYAKASDVAIMQSRMDTYTHLANGSTTGDAELADLRIGADGVTYGNAGDAVRSQFDVQHRLIDDVSRTNNRYDIEIGPMEKGQIDTVTGKDVADDSGSIYRTGFIPVSKPSVLVRALKGGAVALFMYDKAQHLLGWYGGYWEQETKEGYTDLAYIRFTLKGTNQAGTEVVPNGVITNDIIGGIKLYNYSERSNIINVREWGAQGDGLNNDGLIINAAFQIASKRSATVYIPAGTYRLDSTIPTVSNVKVIGDWSASDYSSGTILVDNRTSDLSTFCISFSGKFDISNFALIGNKKLANGLALLNGGWDSYIKNVTVMQFYKTGVQFDKGAEDIHIDGLFINNCGSVQYQANGDYHYGLELTNNTNQLFFNNCHIEHCRLLIGIHGANSISFTNCHIEQSTVGLDQNIPLSPIDHVGSSDILWNNNLLVSINKAAYTNVSANPMPFINYSRGTGTPDYFVSGSFINNAFITGMGSGDAKSTGIVSAQFIDATGPNKVIISGNKFSNVSQDNGIKLGSRSIFTTNHVVYATDAGQTIFTAQDSIVANNIFDLKDNHTMAITNSKNSNNAYYDADGKEIEV
ncbi:BppU family phage baseplate upper protein [Limosilactobacillus reuteri]